MAILSSHHLIISALLLLFLHLTAAYTTSSFRPKALYLPISIDPSTLQYTINLTQRTPPVRVPLTIDLGGPFLWVACDKHYVSTTYRPARCKSPACTLANSKSCGTCNGTPRLGCHNNTCGLFPENPFIKTATSGDLGSDVVRVTSTNGTSPGRVVSDRKFLFSCATNSLLKGLAKTVQGIAGLGKTNISPPSQFSKYFNFARKFAICLPSKAEGGNGALFFGDGPYIFFFKTDLSSLLTFTPLVTNPVSTGATSFPGEPSSEYFIKINRIRINNKEVPIKNPSLLSIDEKGNGGTKLSTTIPYTLMETSIYNAFVNVFVNELKISNVKMVKTVPPFKVCVDPGTFQGTRFSDGTPWINFELDGASEDWTLIGGNSFVNLYKEGISCLAIMDGGKKPRTSIVIGGHQLEDNLVQVDLQGSRIGFSSSLRLSRTSCSMFNFTSTS